MSTHIGHADFCRCFEQMKKKEWKKFPSQTWPTEGGNWNSLIKDLRQWLKSKWEESGKLFFPTLKESEKKERGKLTVVQKKGGKGRKSNLLHECLVWVWNHTGIRYMSYFMHGNGNVVKLHLIFFSSLALGRDWGADGWHSVHRGWAPTQLLPRRHGDDRA
jgi:hypothetical protein